MSYGHGIQKNNCCHVVRCSWCQEPVFTWWVYEWATRLVVFARQLLLTYLPNPM